MKSCSSIAAAVLALAAGCGDNADPSGSPDASNDPPDAPPGPQAVSVRFAAELGDAPFECGLEVAGIGTPAVAYTATDLRFYASQIELIDAGGAAHAVELAPGPFQGQGVALLDFEDGCGDDGTAPLNTSIEGTVDAGTYTGVRFTLGLADELNFVDLAAAQAPLNVTGMFWIWQFGYKFLKLDGSTLVGDVPASYFLHLGSSGCPGENVEAPPTGPCEFPNQVTFELDGFDPATDTIVTDLDAVLAASDLTTNTEGTAPGCMSAADDPECVTVLPRVGVGEGASQLLFRVE